MVFWMVEKGLAVGCNWIFDAFFQKIVKTFASDALLWYNEFSIFVRPIHKAAIQKEDFLCEDV